MISRKSKTFLEWVIIVAFAMLLIGSVQFAEIILIGGLIASRI